MAQIPEGAYPRREDELPELTNLRNMLYGRTAESLQYGYNPNSWKNARNMADRAMNQQMSLIEQIPNTLNQNSEIASEIAQIARTGNIPTGVQNRLNAATQEGLQKSMGTMLNDNANRGIINSSITSQGISNLSQQAADAYNRNYLTAYQAALSGLGEAMQGQQSNTNALVSGIGALGQIPSQAYESAGASLTPAYNMWRTWQALHDNRVDYDYAVEGGGGGGSSCVTGDTMVNAYRPDGAYGDMPVAYLMEGDEIFAWDFDVGCPVSVPLTAFFKRHSDEGFDVIRVEFEDGSHVDIIKEHLFFDMTEGKFVAVNADKMDYIGHEFAKVDKEEGEVIPVKVVDILTDGKVYDAYAPQCEGHFNFIANGFITGNDGQLAMCNMFDFDLKHMVYDYNKRRGDILTYGIINLKEFNEKLADVISYDFFIRNNGHLLSVAIGKGLITEEELIKYLKKFSHCFFNNERGN